MKTKKDTKQLLFENMAKLNPSFKYKLNEIVFDDVNLNSVKVGGESFEKIKRDFPGHAKSVNPIDSPQYKWYKEVFDFMQGEYNNVFEKAELVRFFQNNFLGMDYGVLQTPAETVSWWLSPEQQEFIKGEMNAEGNSVSEDDMGIEPEQGAPIKYRTEVTGIRENVWSTNAKEYDTEEEAKQWLDNLSGRWFGYDMSRVVPTTTPVNQPVDMQNDVIYQNMRKMNELKTDSANESYNDNNDDPLEGNSGTLSLNNGDVLDIIFDEFKGTDNTNSYLVSFGSNNPFRNFTARLSQMQFNVLLNGEEVDINDGGGTLVMRQRGSANESYRDDDEEHENDKKTSFRDRERNAGVESDNTSRKEIEFVKMKNGGYLRADNYKPYLGQREDNKFYVKRNGTYVLKEATTPMKEDVKVVRTHEYLQALQKAMDNVYSQMIFDGLTPQEASESLLSNCNRIIQGYK